MAKGYKTGGRVQGTPNKTTEEIKQIIIQFISKNIDNVQTKFDKLEPKEQLMYLEKLLKYVLSTNTDIAFDNKEKQSQIPPIIIQMTKGDDD